MYFMVLACVYLVIQLYIALDPVKYGRNTHVNICISIKLLYDLYVRSGQTQIISTFNRTSPNSMYRLNVSTYIYIFIYIYIM